MNQKRLFMLIILIVFLLIPNYSFSYDEGDYKSAMEYCGVFDLNGADLSYANLWLANFAHTDLSEANLELACLINADLNQSNLTEADLSYANCTGADFSQANLEEAYLLGTDLEDTDLTGANFKNAYLKNVRLKGTKVKDANFEGAKGLTNKQRQYLRENGAINVPPQADEKENLKEKPVRRGILYEILKHLSNHCWRELRKTLMY